MLPEARATWVLPEPRDVARIVCVCVPLPRVVTHSVFTSLDGWLYDTPGPALSILRSSTATDRGGSPGSARRVAGGRGPGGARSDICVMAWGALCRLTLPLRFYFCSKRGEVEMRPLAAFGSVDLVRYTKMVNEWYTL